VAAPPDLLQIYEIDGTRAREISVAWRGFVSQLSLSVKLSLQRGIEYIFPIWKSRSSRQGITEFFGNVRIFSRQFIMTKFLFPLFNLIILNL